MEQLTDLQRDLMEAAEAWRPYLVRRLRDPREADETVQQVRVQVWLHRDRFDPRQGTAHAWVGGFARLIALERLRALRDLVGAESVTVDTIGVPPDAMAGDSVDDNRRLLRIVAGHVSSDDWEAVSTHAHERSTARVEARSLRMSVDAYRAALQRVQATAETAKAVLLLVDSGGGLSRDALKACVSARRGVADVLAWIDEDDGARLAAAALDITLSAARNRLSAARRLLAIAEAVAEQVTR